MNIRPRLLLTTAAASLPLIATLGWVRFQVEQRAAAEGLVQSIRALMDNGGRAQCERAPAEWGGALTLPPRGPPPPPGMPPPRMFAYDRQGSPGNPAAPPLEPSLRAQLQDGRPVARGRSPGPLGREVEDFLMPMAWGDGPCALVLVRRPLPPLEGALRAFFPPVEFWLPPTAVALLGLAVAVGPVVRRLRALQVRVLESARGGYQGEVGVGGSDEIGDLARAFEQAGREVRAQMEEQRRREQTLRDFLENTTHDVMIPLTVLQGHLAALVERASRGQPPEQAALDGAVQEAHYMSSLVHNLAAAAKLEAGEPAVQ
ncbi:MAG TPA: histidine kinase dimerization/phospho-acceptor domain-containing protein, partial [Myxococcales bacterium]|nr:histidine kinase dimerization/phospho-acceptor domain-containing protein [Myxococcales bacterium]